MVFSCVQGSYVNFIPGERGGGEGGGGGEVMMGMLSLRVPACVTFIMIKAATSRDKVEKREDKEV